jgi:SAM-dependent methyltransferase
VCFDQLPEPHETLEEICRILKPRGWLFLQVPNGEFVKWTETLARLPGLRERIWRIRAYTGIAGFPYPIGYTPPALKRLLSAAGFDAVQFCNRMNISDGPARPERLLPEQIAIVRRTHAIAEWVYRLSGRKQLVGPWIEASCRKEEDS